MDFKLRLIEPTDNTSLSSIIKFSLEDLDCALDGTVYTDEATDHMYDGYRSEGTIYYIAESGGKVIGGSGIAPIPNQDKNYCELQRMFLTKEARGLGIGKALMDKCISFAKDFGYELVYLETFDTMHAAQKLYKRSGFEYIDHGLGDTGHFSCDIKMALEL